MVSHTIDRKLVADTLQRKQLGSLNIVILLGVFFLIIIIITIIFFTLNKIYFLFQTAEKIPSA